MLSLIPFSAMLSSSSTLTFVFMKLQPLHLHSNMLSCNQCYKTNDNRANTTHFSMISLIPFSAALRSLSTFSFVVTKPHPLHFHSDVLTCSRCYQSFDVMAQYARVCVIVESGNTKGGSMTVPLTSCLTGLD